MRYTEARLTEFAIALMEGLNENAVDFMDTYDGEEQEPVVMPAAVPNLLCNGSAGIAVGMATRIMPHNFNELLQAQIAVLRGESFALYPDFQQGGVGFQEAFGRPAHEFYGGNRQNRGGCRCGHARSQNRAYRFHQRYRPVFARADIRHHGLDSR